MIKHYTFLTLINRWFIGSSKSQAYLFSNEVTDIIPRIRFLTVLLLPPDGPKAHSRLQTLILGTFVSLELRLFGRNRESKERTRYLLREKRQLFIRHLYWIHTVMQILCPNLRGAVNIKEILLRYLRDIP